MYKDLPEPLRMQVRQFLEDGNFQDAKRMHDRWRCEDETQKMHALYDDEDVGLEPAF